MVLERTYPHFSRTLMALADLGGGLAVCNSRGRRVASYAPAFSQALLKNVMPWTADGSPEIIVKPEEK